MTLASLSVHTNMPTMQRPSVMLTRMRLFSQPRSSSTLSSYVDGAAYAVACVGVGVGVGTRGGLVASDVSLLSSDILVK